MIKVCHISTVHPLSDTRIFQKEIKTLKNFGYDISLVIQNNKDEIAEGVKILALPRPASRLARIFLLPKKTYDIACANKYDVYHFHDPELIPIMLIVKWKTKAKIIYDVHEDVPKQILNKLWIPKILRKIISIVFNFFEKIISKKFDYIITATPSIRDNFKQTNVIDVRNYPIINGDLYSGDKKKRNANTLIYAGALDENRGILEIVKSLKFIDPKYKARLKLIGNFSEKEFENKIKKLPEWNGVDFLGQLSLKEVYENIRGAGIGLACFRPVSNYIDSLPTKLFEYMSVGLPVIVSNFPLFEKIIKENKCGICVDSLVVKQIAKAAECLMENPGQAEIMGGNGKRAVLEKFNWENESKKLLKVYEQLCKR